MSCECYTLPRYQVFDLKNRTDEKQIEVRGLDIHLFFCCDRRILPPRTVVMCHPPTLPHHRQRLQVVAPIVGVSFNMAQTKVAIADAGGTCQILSLAADASEAPVVIRTAKVALPPVGRSRMLGDANRWTRRFQDWRSLCITVTVIPVYHVSIP